MIYYFEYIHLSFSPLGPVGEKVRLQSRRKKDRICLPNKKKKEQINDGYISMAKLRLSVCKFYFSLYSINITNFKI